MLENSDWQEEPAHKSSMYTRPMWEDGYWLRTDQVAFFTYSLEKFCKISNKLGKIGIN